MARQEDGRSQRRVTAGLVAGAVALAAAAVAMPGAGAAPARASTSQPSAVGLDNPYVGADQYVNVDWSAEVARVAAPIDGPLSFALGDAAAQPTAVWLRRYSDATASSGLKHHLDAALAQQEASGRPVVMTLVLDARPARDCHTWESPSDLSDAQTMALYHRYFLDPLVELLTQSEYASLRIAAVVEPGVTDEVMRLRGSVNDCPVGAIGRFLVPTLTADLEALAEVPNAYAYLDGGTTETLDWAEPRLAVLATYDMIVKGTTRGRAGITGFAVGVGGYTPVTEPYVSLSASVAGAPVRSAAFVDWRDAIDLETRIALTRSVLAAKGWETDSLGFVLDTSRNGWGGPDRPTGEGPRTSVDAYVDGGRLDRRTSVAMFCNQGRAGMGARPVAAPAEGIDAYVWVNNPGVSDGRDPAAAPQDGQDLWAPPECGRSVVAPDSSGREIDTGALPSGPNRGAFFDDLLVSLAVHAYPALDDGYPTGTTSPSSTTSKTTTSKTRTKSKTTKPKTTKPKSTKTRTTKTGTTKTRTTKTRTTTKRTTRPATRRPSTE